MTPTAPRAMSARHRMLLILLSVAGTILIVLSASRYGAGLSPDSGGNVATYTAFLVAASTTTAYDRIGDRLLSPVYIPATLLWDSNPTQCLPGSSGCSASMSWGRFQKFSWRRDCAMVPSTVSLELISSRAADSAALGRPWRGSAAGLGAPPAAPVAGSGS